MKISVYIIIIFGTVISSCSNKIYKYTTDNFDIQEGSTVYIVNNDSVKCTGKYHPAMNLIEIDNDSRKIFLREIDISYEFEKNISKRGILKSENIENSDYLIEFQDYLLCKRKKSFGSFTMNIKNLRDTSQGALIICKSFGQSETDYEKISSDLIESLFQTDLKSFHISINDLNKYPKIYDIPKFPKKQIGINFGYSLSSLPHSDLYENHSSYINSTNIFYGGFDFDYFYKDYSGFGIKTAYYFGKNNQQNADQFDENGSIIGTGELKDDVSYIFIGPELIGRIPIFSYKSLDVIKLSLGYLKYQNNSIRFDESVKYSANTIAFIFSAGLDFEINKHLYLGLEPKFRFAGFNKMEINNNKNILENKEYLNSVEFAVIFKIN